MSSTIKNTPRGLSLGILASIVFLTVCSAASASRLKGSQLWSKSVSKARQFRQFYVAPGGRPDGEGTEESPWDIRSALGGRQKIPSGSVVWLREGRYGRGGATTFSINLQGKEKRPIIVRGYPGERATINGGLKGAGGVAWVWLWGFEITNTDANRNRNRKTKPRGIDVNAKGLRIINMIINNTSGATSNWKGIGDGGGLFGNIMWGNGVYTPSPVGGGVYGQNTDGTRYYKDNISFRNFTQGLDAHSSGTAHADGFHVEGNVVFDNGWWGIQIMSKAFPVSRLKIIENYTYSRRGSSIGKSTFQAGYYGTQHNDIEVRDNYFMLGPHDRSFFIRKFRHVQVVDNTFAGPHLLMRVEMGEEKKLVFGSNRYYGGSNRPFQLNSDRFTFSDWRSNRKIDSGSQYQSGYPTRTRVFVRTNEFEPGRAHIIIYNWGKQKKVSANLSKVLKPGMRYEVRDAQDYYGRPILEGVYASLPISIPMDQTTIARPLGNCPHIQSTFRHTAPEFGVYVVQLKHGSSRR